MQKIILKTLIMGFLFLLVSCQAGPVKSIEHTFQSLGTPRPTLAESVKDALSRNPDPMIAQVQVTNSPEAIILSGYVKKIRQSDTAEQIAHQVPGVQAVANRIIVRP